MSLSRRFWLGFAGILLLFLLNGGIVNYSKRLVASSAEGLNRSNERLLRLASLRERIQNFNTSVKLFGYAGAPGALPVMAADVATVQSQLRDIRALLRQFTYRSDDRGKHLE